MVFQDSYKKSFFEMLHRESYLVGLTRVSDYYCECKSIFHLLNLITFLRKFSKEIQRWILCLFNSGLKCASVKTRITNLPV
jgi:hypothetical protein